MLVALVFGQTAWAGINISFEEEDIPKGDTDFFFKDVHFVGGIVGTQFMPPLYCSGSNSYEVDADQAATITFPEPFARAKIYFSNKADTDSGTVTAVLANGEELRTVTSLVPEQRCDPDNFVIFEDTNDPLIGITELRLQAGAGSGKTLFLDDLILAPKCTGNEKIKKAKGKTKCKNGVVKKLSLLVKLANGTPGDLFTVEVPIGNVTLNSSGTVKRNGTGKAKFKSKACDSFSPGDFTANVTWDCGATASKTGSVPEDCPCP